MTVDERIAELADMVQQLRAADTRMRVFGSPAHGYRLHPRLTEGEIRQFESNHGVTLPEDYRLFLQVVGNGGPGPSYGLETLAKTAAGCDPRTPFPFEGTSEGYPEDVQERWFDDRPGVLELCHHGCAIYSYLVVNGAPWGTIWDAEGLPSLSEPSFARWYWLWADQSLRRLHKEHLAQCLRPGMTTAEVMDAVEGAWKKRTSADGTVTWFEAPGIPVQLELDDHDLVVKLTPWMFL